MKNTLNSVYVKLIQGKNFHPPKDFTKITKYYVFNGVPAMNHHFINRVIHNLNTLL